MTAYRERMARRHVPMPSSSQISPVWRLVILSFTLFVSLSDFGLFYVLTNFDPFFVRWFSNICCFEITFVSFFVNFVSVTAYRSFLCAYLFFSFSGYFGFFLKKRVNPYYLFVW